MQIINLTQHKATADQIEAGVVDLPHGLYEEVKSLLTFDDCPTLSEMAERANAIAAIAAGLAHPLMGGAAMIGGAPFSWGRWKRL